MDRTWTLGVLHPDAETVTRLDEGEEATAADAYDAATDALVNAARAGRQEYRLTVGEVRMIVVPGLTAGGLVDVMALRDALGQPGLCR